MATERNPKNLYVAGLPANYDDAALRLLFSRFGGILHTKVFARPGSVGYGFVNFGSPAAAQAAIAAMDGSECGGVALQVRIAGQEARTQNRASAGYPSSGPGPRSNVYVAGWPLGFEEDALRKAFEPFGKIVSLRLCPRAKSQGGRVYGFVHFESEGAAHKAIHAMNGQKYGGAELQVRIASNADGGAGVPESVKARVFLSNERHLGNVETMKGKYGWIVPRKPIKHAMAVMHNGRVFVHTQDFEGVGELKEGDAVSFMAYTDVDGLGAASVQLEDQLEQGGEEEACQEKQQVRASAARGPHWRRHQPRPAAAGGDADSSTQSVGTGVPNTKGAADIYVKGWPKGLTDVDFRQVFEQFGSLLSIDLRAEKATGTAWAGRMHGYARFHSRLAAEAAVEAMDSVVYGGVPLQVSLGGDDASPSPTSATDVVEPGLQAQVRIGKGRYFGKVSAWKGKFGWISPERRVEDIDEQPLVRAVSSKHHGRFYVHERDIEGASELSVGDRVSFLAYADWDGLGASEVRQEAHADPAAMRREVRTRIRPLAAPHVSAAKPQSRPTNSEGAAGNGTVCKSAAESKSAAVSNASGTSAVGSGSTPASSPAPPAAWWHGLAGDCCPISLTPFEELEQEPFGLLATAEAIEEPQSEGLWGAAAVAAYYSMQAVHWFHGLFLACSVVSSVQFMDPVSLRRLSRGECESLDRYLSFHNFPAVHVSEAFDLGKQVASTGDGSRTDASERLASLGRDAASILRIWDEGDAPPAATATPSSMPVKTDAMTAPSDTAHVPVIEASCTEAATPKSTAGDQEAQVGPEGMSTVGEAAPSASPDVTPGAATPGGRRRRWQK